VTELRSRLAAPSVALISIAASIIGIVNEFTYDDRFIVAKNAMVRSPHGWWRVFLSPYWPRDWGGDGYRPLTILAFKSEYFVGHGSPAVFHVVNIGLCALASVLVFSLASRLLPTWAAWITAALFAVHPVHVEAVANVVGQSELIVACAIVAATSLYLRDRLLGRLHLSTAVQMFALYAVACFAKEHGIVLPAILAAAELFVIPDESPWADRIRRLRPVYLTFMLIAVSFLAIRSHVLADHSLGGFAPFTAFSTLQISSRDRVLTALGVVPQWLRLLYWPAHLSSEYGPPEIAIAQGWSVSLLPGTMLIVAILALAIVLRRRQPIVSFGISFACLALLPSSNFLIPAGIVLAERTLFLPSVGAVLATGSLCVAAADRYRTSPHHIGLSRAAQAVLILVLAAGMARSIQRTPVWRENDRLFHQAVIDSPDSYRAHYMLGAWDFEEKRRREGEAEYHKALSLFPYDAYLSFSLAEQYRLWGLCGPAVPLYRWSRSLDPSFPLGHGVFAWCLLNEGQYDEARQQALEAITAGGDLKGMRKIIFLADSSRVADQKEHVSHDTVVPAGHGILPETVQKSALNANARPPI